MEHGLNLLTDLEAVDVGHRFVEEDKIDWSTPDLSQGVGPTVGRDGRKSFEFENCGEELHDICVVIADEDRLSSRGVVAAVRGKGVRLGHLVTGRGCLVHLNPLSNADRYDSIDRAPRSIHGPNCLSNRILQGDHNCSSMRRMYRSARRSHDLLRPSVLLVTMMACAYMYSIARGFLPNSDSHLALTRAIVDRHTFRIDSYAGVLIDRASYRGHFYTDKAPGLSIALIPAYLVTRLLSPAVAAGQFDFIARYAVTFLGLGVPSALFIGLAWRTLLPYAGRRVAAFLLVLYGLATPVWPLSSILFSHVVAALLLYSALTLLRWEGRGGRARRWAVAGLCCGLSISCEYPSAVISILLFFFAVYETRKGEGSRWHVILFVVAGVVGLLPLLVYNVAVYGSVFSQGYAHLGGLPQFRAGMSHGIEGVGLPTLAALWGITFSPYRGLFFYSPVLLLVIPGLYAMGRSPRSRPTAVMCGGAIAAMLLFNGGYYFWDGGATIGPRHLVLSLPFYLPPIAVALRRRRWRRAALVLGLISLVLIGFSTVAAGLYPPGELDPLLNVAWWTIQHASPNNWGRVFGLTGVVSFAPLIVIEAVLGACLWSATGRIKRVAGPPSQDTLTPG